MDGFGEKWWLTLTARQTAGIACYAVSVVLLTCSLFFPFWEIRDDSGYGDYGEADGTWEIYQLIVSATWRGDLLGAPHISLWEDVLPAISLLFGTLFLVPGMFLLFLSLRSRLCCWLGSGLWLFFVFAGPWLLILFYREEYLFRAGAYSFFLWQSLALIAHLLVTPSRGTSEFIAPGVPQPPGTEQTH